MSGKAILVLVVGVIIITATIMFNIEAASTRIVKNFTDYYMRQNTQNIAQSGVNLAITQLGKDRNWRAGFSNLALLDGVVDVNLSNGTFDSIPAIVVKSIATTDYGNNQKRRDTSIAYLFLPRKQYPINVKALMTLNANSGVNGTITIDGRNHDVNGNLIAGGVPAVWSTASTFTIGSASAKLGGTDAGVDYAPANPPPPQSIKLNQPPPAGGFPTTPDSVFGGMGLDFPEGTLKAIAMSGYAGSQYVTDPGQLKYPLNGVTYVEMPAVTPKNIWSSADISGSGILVVHNSAGNAELSNTKSEFKGLIITDDVEHLHGELLGGLVALRNSLTGNVIGNGSAKILFSYDAIVEASKFLEIAGAPNVIAWWE
jgi:hypothetical protein